MVSPNQEKMTLRVAIVGLGRMGLRHVEAVRSLGMEVVGLCDISKDAVDNAASSIGLGHAGRFTDAAVMFRTVRPKAVVVASTAPSHSSLVLAAAECGATYILCEKPFAASLAEVEAMTRACAERGVVLAVNHQMRFMPNYASIKSMIDGQEFGPMVSMIVAGSNFGLAMNGSHYFEAFRWMTGSRVAAVQAQLEPDILANPRGDEFDDRSGRILAINDAGQTLYLDFSAKAGWGLQVIYVCRNGQVFVDELNGDVRLAARQSEFRDLPTSRYGLPVNIRCEKIPPAETVRSTMDVWRSMVGGADYPGPDVGEHVLACLVACHISHRDGGRLTSTDLPTTARQERFYWA